MRRLMAKIVVGSLALTSPAAAEEAPAAPTAAASAAAPSGVRLEVTGHVDGRLEQVGGYEIDRLGTEYDPGLGASTLVRLGVRFDTRRTLAPIALGAELEADAITGWLTDAPGVDGQDMPRAMRDHAELRKAYGRLSLGHWVHLMGGAMTSQWGMGLLANDGATFWEPGSARFASPQSGDRVLRGTAIVLPWHQQGLGALFAVDRVIDDNITFDGDEATQMVAAAFYGMDLSRPDRKKDTFGGVYVVRRQQEARDGDRIEVTVVDATGQHTLKLSETAKLKLEAEAALVVGETTLSASADFPTKDVLQLGWAARGTLDMGRWGAVLDLLYASGDRNFDDREQRAFKANRNYELGFLLYRHVLAAHTGRARVTAHDLELVGVPPEDVERVATRGGASNTFAAFPRVWWRATPHLELYGGPLVAFSAVEVADPFTTRLAGGSPRNALDGSPGAYLGTEIDVGARYFRDVGDVQLHFGLEGGAFLPGSAFEDASGETLGAVLGARAMLEVRL